MNNNKYQADIYKAYQEELGGEVFFEALGELFEAPEQAYKLRVLAQLERETAQRLKPLVTRYGFDPALDAGLHQESLQEATDYFRRSWGGFLSSLGGSLPRYIGEYRRLETIAPADDLPALHALTLHEEALLQFVECEMNGQSDRALESVLDLLTQVPSR